MQFMQVSSFIALSTFLISALPCYAQFLPLSQSTDMAQSLSFPCTDVIGSEVQNNAERIRQNIARSSRDAQNTAEAHSSSSSSSARVGVQIAKIGLNGQYSSSASASDSFSQGTDIGRSSDDGYEYEYDRGTSSPVVAGQNCDSSNESRAAIEIQRMQTRERQTQYLYDRILGIGAP
jgi:hypothetical protein